MALPSLADLLRAAGPARGSGPSPDAVGGRWFPAHTLGYQAANAANVANALKEAVKGAVRPKPLPKPAPPPPPTPPPDPEALREAAEAALDAVEGATEAEEGQPGAGAAQGVARGQVEGGMLKDIVRGLVPGDGPVSRMSEDALAVGIEQIIGGLKRPWPPLPFPRPAPASRPRTPEEVREQQLNQRSDPYIALEERARQEGRAVSEKERRAFERYPEALQAQMIRDARADYSRRRAEEAYRAAKARGVDPSTDADYRFWDQTRGHDLQALYDADRQRR